MLTVQVVLEQGFNDDEQVFVTLRKFDLTLEHSLVSLSKWESTFKKPFLTEEKRTPEELIGYVKAMALDPDVPPEVFEKLSEANFDEILEYMADTMTGTTFQEEKSTPSRETWTAELVYYMMFTYQIHHSCETWHLNRLFTLIRVFQIKNSDPKKVDRSTQAKKQRDINAERRAKLKSKG